MKFICLFLAIGCGKVGDDTGRKGAGDTGDCAVTDSGEATLSEAPLGFSMSDWLSTTGGTWTGTLATSETSEVATVDLSFTGDTVYWEQGDCGSFYRLDLTAAMSAGEGVVDDTIAMTTWVREDGASLTWEGTELGGSLVDPDASSVRIQGDLADGTLTMDIVATTTSDMGDGVGSQSQDTVGTLELTHD